MKYSDIQRLHKIHDTATKLDQYIKDNNIKREDLIEDF